MRTPQRIDDTRARPSMPWNGSSSSNSRAGSACQRASTTFCWLPPDGGRRDRHRRQCRTVRSPSRPPCARVRRTAPLANQRDGTIKAAIDANGTLSGNSDVRQRSSPARNTPARIAPSQRGRHVRPSSVISPGRPHRAEDRPREARLPAADSCDRDDLATPDIEVERCTGRRQPHLPHAEACLRLREPARPAPMHACGGNGRPIIVPHRRVEIDRRGQIGDDPPSRTIAARSAMRRKSPSRCDTRGWRRRRGATRPPARTAARPPPPTGWRSARRESATMAARPAHAPVTRCWSASDSEASGAARLTSARPVRRAIVPPGARGRHAPRRGRIAQPVEQQVVGDDSVGTTASATDWCTVATPSRLAACGDAGR